VVLGMMVNPAWLYVAGVIGALMISERVSPDFVRCIFILNKMMPAAETEKPGN